MSDKLLTCPYNPSHQILPHRFATHLTKCARQYPEIILERCAFNSTHLFPAAELAAHQKNCPDRITFDKAMNPIDVGYQYEDLPAPSKHYDDDDGDNWEDEVGTQNAFDASNTKQAGKK